MKTTIRIAVIIIFSVGMFLTTIVFADIFIATTKDGEVTSILDVQVERTEQRQIKKRYTLRHVNTKIATLEADITYWRSIRDAIEPIADEVKLKVEEVVE